jgi:uncharacterized protein (TIGR03435 family)
MQYFAVGRRNQADNGILAPACSTLLAIASLPGVITVAFPSQATAIQAQAQRPAPQLARSSAGKPSSPQTASSRVLEWQLAAGGKMEFDIASVKRNTVDPGVQPANSNILLGPNDLFTPTGGFFSATNYPLIAYVVFAYKLTLDQVQVVRSQMPRWMDDYRYDIQARASGNPTKDQFRLMMQTLLGERFKLAVHYVTRQLPVMGLIMDKPGRFGQQLRPHKDSPPCSNPDSSKQGPVTAIAGGFPEVCGAVFGMPATTPGRIRLGARSLSMARVATSLNFPRLSGVERPIVDGTGLSGEYDFVIEFTPQTGDFLPLGSNFQPDESGPSFVQALKEQLGLKLDSQKGPLNVLVLDHVELPYEN